MRSCNSALDCAGRARAISGIFASTDSSLLQRCEWRAAFGQRFKEAARLRQDQVIDIGVFRQAAHYFGVGNGVVEGAERVDQAAVKGLGAGPDSAFGEVDQLLAGELWPAAARFSLTLSRNWS